MSRSDDEYRKEQLQLNIKIQNARKYKEMMQTEGWKMLEEGIHKEIDKARHEVWTGDLKNERCIKIQSAGQTLEQLLSSIKNTLKLGDEAQVRQAKIIQKEKS